MLAQSEGNYAEALQNYYEATRLESDPYDRSYENWLFTMYDDPC